MNITKTNSNYFFFFLKGAVLDTYNNNELEQFFNFAIDAANGQDFISNLKLSAQVSTIPYGNEFLASKKLCKFLKVCDF